MTNVSLIDEPVKGKYYLIPYHASGDQPKYGTRVCQFHERKYLGCQLHGELIGYEYCFKLNPESDIANVRVKIPCDDNTSKKQILEGLYGKIKPYGERV